MWWVIDVVILAIFSIHLGNWVADKLYESGWFRYEYMRDFRGLCVLVVGVISVFYLAIKP